MRGARVLLVSSSYPFHRGDFHALFVHEMARALVRRGAEAFVLTPKTPHGGAWAEVWEGVVVERFPYAGLKRLPVTGGEGLLENLKRHPLKAASLPSLFGALLIALRRALCRLSPDLVVTHWLVPSGLAAALVAPSARIVHVAHSSDVHLLARVPGGAAIVRLLAESGPLLATSHTLAARLRALGAGEAVRPWHLGVELPFPRRRRARSGPLRVRAHARFTEEKGLSTLLRAASLLPDVDVALAGAGPSAPRLREEIAALGLADRARLLPPVLGDKKRAFLDEADVFAFVPRPRPGGFEDNLPVSVLEAMAHGVPIVATRVGALPELLERGGGVLVGPEPEEVAAALGALFTARLLSLGKEARHIAEGYGWDASLRRLEEAAFGERSGRVLSSDGHDLQERCGHPAAPRGASAPSSSGSA